MKLDEFKQCGLTTTYFSETLDKEIFTSDLTGLALSVWRGLGEPVSLKGLEICVVVVVVLLLVLVGGDTGRSGEESSFSGEGEGVMWPLLSSCKENVFRWF